MTVMGMKRVTPRKGLQRKTGLKSHGNGLKKTPLAKQSKRAKSEMKTWMQIKLERMSLLYKKFGYIPCEYCKIAVDPRYDIYAPEAHHNDKNRRNNTPENCRILHRMCNQHIEDINFRNVPSLLDKG